MTITVTQEHIKLGRPSDCGLCPIALAMRHLNKEIHVEVDHVLINGETFPLPDAAVQFIDNFDELFTVEPFSFELEITH